MICTLQADQVGFPLRIALSVSPREESRALGMVLVRQAFGGWFMSVVRRSRWWWRTLGGGGGGGKGGGNDALEATHGTNGIVYGKRNKGRNLQRFEPKWSRMVILVVSTLMMMRVMMRIITRRASRRFE